MNFDQGLHKCVLTLWLMVLALPWTSLTAQAQARTQNVIVWDTMAPLGDIATIQNRGKWQVVPPDLLLLEANPRAAMADPSHYGRSYAFKGDAVVENLHLIAAFPAQAGSMVIYSKADLKKKVELVPMQLKGHRASIAKCSIIQNTGDEATLDLSFSAGGETDTLNVSVSLGRTGIVAVKPAESMKGVSMVSDIAYGVVPSFVGDDLVFAPGHYPALDTLCIPSESLFLGLLKGQSSMLVVTWPEGKQAVTLSLNTETPRQGLIESVDVENDGKNLYLALLEAPDIWHKEELKRSYLERDIATNWTRPFHAKWKTQLLEGGIRTTFVFQEAKQNIWRGGVGSYIYPVWFDGDTAMVRLSKKIPPKGESVIYFTERQGTPLSVSAPMDIVEASLGRAAYDVILDAAGRQLRTHHRRGAAGIRRACTCGCTEAIEAIFKAGEEVNKKAYVEAAVDDMVYFVTRHLARIDEYQEFARDIVDLLEQTDPSPGELKPFIDSMAEITRELQEECSRARENMKTLAYAGQLAQQTKALTQNKAPGNLQACLELGKQWRAMGGAQDDVLAQSHRLVRKLFVEAGYQGVQHPRAAEITRRIRAMCRQCLRNPDGYEIWPDY